MLTKNSILTKSGQNCNSKVKTIKNVKYLKHLNKIQTWLKHYGTSAAIFLLIGNYLNASIDGTLSYTKRDTSTSAIRWSSIEILDASDDSVIATGTTSSSGTFSIDYTSPPSNVKIRVKTEYSGAAKVVDASGNTYNTVSSSVPSSSTISYTFSYDSTISAYLFLFDTLHSCYQYALARTTAISSSDSIGELTLYWPSGNWSYYLSGTIHIPSGDEWDDDLVLHEYGHHVMYYLSSIPMGGSHYMTGIYDPRLAWSEGWANYYVCAIRGSSYTLYNVNLDPLTSAYPLSPGNELRIAAGLWKAHSDSSVGADNIFRALDAMEYPYYRDIYDFYSKWSELGLTSAVLPHLESQGIYVTSQGSLDVGFDSNLVSDSSATYYWQPGWSRHQYDYTPWGVNWRGDSSSNLGGGYMTGSASLNYNNNTSYDTGYNYGWAQSPKINLTNISNPVLSFKCNYQTETRGDSKDKRRIQIINATNRTLVLSELMSTSPGSQNLRNCHEMGFWHTHVLSLQNSWGEVFIRFYFDSVDSGNNNFAGWFVDEIKVLSGDSGMPPFAPTYLNQYKLSGSELPKTEINSDTSVKIKSTLNSYYTTNQVKLQVEVKPISLPFDSGINAESSFVANGESVEIIVNNLAKGDHHWRARVVDSAGNTSDWFHFGENQDGETDLIIQESSRSSNSGGGDSGGGGGGGGGGCGGTIMPDTLAGNKLPLVTIICLLLLTLYQHLKSQRSKFQPSA